MSPKVVLLTYSFSRVEVYGLTNVLGNRNVHVTTSRVMGTYWIIGKFGIVCVCVRVRACVHACVYTCVRVYECICVRMCIGILIYN